MLDADKAIIIEQKCSGANLDPSTGHARTGSDMLADMPEARSAANQVLADG
jgi:hypothetical protein